jgi:hypothetical protein
VLCTGVGHFFQAALVLCQYSDWIHRYITSSSHFTKTLPPELTWQINFSWYPPPELTQQKFMKSKNMVLSENWQFFEGFEITQNWQFFDSDVFQIPGTNQFFDSDLLKYPELTSSLILIF